LTLRPADPKKVIKVLVYAGFRIERQRGSHVVLKHPDGRMTVVPVHGGEEIGRGLLRTIIAESGLGREEFLRLLEEL
jgi:predicted RNA binding protein YcfA (HicA-like mRNA interferase family)